ncbi:hypothetical protein LY90DRAFT_664957 [Neocallimastix californiae]|uniref:Uncharacterized protein n=1 Tax=Neocallimastix californiae TaxID=1754190 RepID=A0A1Y2F628_9FUNG|nr:hypothetical protein LY90DRAFT_664957 [Neocallimastix californiae]|eukprot:ORY78796.1 hypothetical protein LY90DRAFT_664957 [Neocallimastix californiae]
MDNIILILNTLNKIFKYIIRTYLIISLITHGITFASAYYTNSYFDFNIYDRILNIGNFNFEKGGEITVKLGQIILQYNERRFLTFSNYTFFNDLYIGVCETQQWLDFMRENDNNNNNPYYKNITSSDNYKNNTSINESDDNNLKRRMIEEIIIENIKDSEYITNDPIINYKAIKNITSSFKLFNKNNTFENTKMKVSELLTGIYFLPENQYDMEENYNIIYEDNIVNDEQRINDEIYNYDNDSNTSNNSTDYKDNDNYIIVDRFYELLMEANICSNITTLYDLATDLENYRFHTVVPNDNQYSVFMLKTRSLILMGFDGEIELIFKNPYKYPHLSTDQYSIVKYHLLLLGIWSILFLLWICIWINKLKIKLPLVKLIVGFTFMNVIILGLETYKYHFYGKNGEYSIPIIIFLALLLMLRTTYICIGMLYFSKGIYIIRKMMIPDETRSILAIAILTALTDAVFVGLGEGSAIAMSVYKILLYSYLYKNYIHHIYVLWKYINKIKKDYNKENSKINGKQNDRLTKMTYEELHKLMQPDFCQPNNCGSINNPIRFSPNQPILKPNNTTNNNANKGIQPPTPARSSSLNKSSNNCQIPQTSNNNVYHNSNENENYKISASISNLSDKQWNNSNISVPLSPSKLESSKIHKNEEKKLKNTNKEINKNRKKIISIEDNSLLYYKLLLDSYHNKLTLLILLLVVTILITLVDIICRVVYLPYYYDNNLIFYLIYESFFIISFICYSVILYPRSPKKYIWIPKWVIENTTQSISDNEIEYMN